MFRCVIYRLLVDVVCYVFGCSVSVGGLEFHALGCLLCCAWVCLFVVYFLLIVLVLRCAFMCFGATLALVVLGCSLRLLRVKGCCCSLELLVCSCYVVGLVAWCLGFVFWWCLCLDIVCMGVLIWWLPVGYLVVLWPLRLLCWLALFGFWC